MESLKESKEEDNLGEDDIEKVRVVAGKSSDDKVSDSKPVEAVKEEVKPLSVLSEAAKVPGPSSSTASEDKPVVDAKETNEVSPLRNCDAEPNLAVAKFDGHNKDSLLHENKTTGTDAITEEDGEDQASNGQATANKDEESEYYNNDLNRGKWDNKWQFILATLTHGIGIRSWFLVSYIHSEYGGWPLIIPISIMLALAVYPVFFLETVMGQFSSTGYSRAFIVAPTMAGVAGVMCTLNVASVIYYSTVSAYPLAYVFRLLSYEKPWNDTAAPINEDISHFIEPEKFNTSEPSSVYFVQQAKRLYDGVYEDWSFAPSLMGLVVLIWVLVFLCVWKGIYSVRKAVYITSALPMLFAVIICFKGFFVEYNNEAYRPFQTRFGPLLRPETWFLSAVLAIYSLGQGHGIILTLASYNNFRQRIMYIATNVPWFVVVLSSCAVPVMNEFYGYLHHIGFKDSVSRSLGLNFAFLVYPDYLAASGGLKFWGVCFYLSLFLYEFHSVVMQTFTIVTTFFDGTKMGPMSKTILSGVSCIFYCAIAIACASKGMLPPCDKLFWFGIIIHMLILLAEVTTFAWVYNYRRLARDIKCMFGKAFIDNLVKSTTQILIPPLTIFIIMIMLICKGMPYIPEQYGLVSYGVIVAYLVLALIKVFGVIAYRLGQQNFTWQKFFKINLERPKQWHPADLEHRLEYEQIIRDEPPLGWY